MKIGIITFHWGTNYGAIMQSYALQNVLSKMGHVVFIINYKPQKYDYKFFNMIRSRALLRPFAYSKNSKREKGLKVFRERYLNLTNRYYSIAELKDNPPVCDLYISGSDQVFNPSFLKYGEDGNKQSTAYFLDFGTENVLKLGYAVSFGCTEYPTDLISIIEPLVQNFKEISVRENTGAKILNIANYYRTTLVPDPTLLLKRHDYEALISHCDCEKKDTVFYLIHDRNRLEKRIKSIYRNSYNIINNMTVESWLCDIKYTNKMITNSFHGVVFSLIFHVKFVVILESKMMTGGNDRFYTILKPLGLLDHIIEETEFNKVNDILTRKIDWFQIDKCMSIIAQKGDDFLMENIRFS